MKLFTLTGDKLPTESGCYVVITEYNEIRTLSYSSRYNLFNVCDFNSEYEANVFAITTMAWCKLEDFMKEIGYEVK